MSAFQLSEICRRLVEAGFQARLEGEDRRVHAVNTLEEAGPGELTFLSNPRYLGAVSSTKAACIVVKDGVVVPEGLAAIRCSDPYGAIAVAIVILHGHRKHPHWGISADAHIHPTAKLGANPNLAPGVTIGSDAVIGDDCTMYAGCFVGDHARIGRGCVLFPNVVLYDFCELGDRVTIHAGSVIGEDGLGYAPHEGHWVKIPQVGRAVIGDDVEIGANCTIDRATLGRTEIGAGTKFGNVIVVGHGTRIGPDCMFVGLVGIAGSATIGRHVTLAGQVGIAGHLSIGDDASVGAQAGVVGDIEPGAKVLGSPALPVEDTKRSVLWLQRLPDLGKRVRDLERQLANIEKRLDGSRTDV